MNEIESTIERLYRSDSARLLAVLTRIFGVHNLELAEDVLQEAFGKALAHWQENGIPENPSAWIITTARHQAIDTIRAGKTRLKFADDLSQHLQSEWSLTSTIDQQFEQGRIKDDQLRMIFMCCHESIKAENRIPFILRTLCGFSLPAIANALLLPEATVKKRLFRTRQQLRHHRFELPDDNDLNQSMDSVHTVLYLLFNEGFHSSDANQAIKIEFCQEAVGLVNLLINEPAIANRDTLALFALMHFHIARIDSRVDSDGANIPIDLQDRSLWRQEYLNTAKHFLGLAQSPASNAGGRFYIEAQIASQHCQASSFEQTDWASIVALYQQLIELTGSPVAKLNQAVAIAYNGDINHAIKQVEELLGHRALRQSQMPFAIMAHLHALAGNKSEAYAAADKATSAGGAPREHQIMLQQIDRRLNQRLPNSG